MAQMQNAQTIALQLEKVRDKVPLLYERDDVLLTMIQQRGDVEKVSSRNMRLPLQIRPGGKAGATTRTAATSAAVRAPRTTWRRSRRFSSASPWRSPSSWSTRTNAQEKAIENAAKREVANGMKQFRSFLDKLIQTGGNGVLGTIERRSAGNTIHRWRPRRARRWSTWARRFRSTIRR